MAEDIRCMKERMANYLKSHIDAGLEQLPTDEVGKIADIIKDLSEAEYYCSVVEAMDEVDEDEMYGYSKPKMPKAKFPKNKSRATRDWPYVHSYLNDPDFTEQMRMGYHSTSVYGKSYDEYETAKSMSDRDTMNARMSEHVKNFCMTVKEMWTDADPVLRAKMKTDLQNMINDLK